MVEKKMTNRMKKSGGNGEMVVRERIRTKWSTIHQLTESIRIKNNSAIQSRAELSGQLGKSFGSRRDLYNVLGYNKEPLFDDFYNRYKRQDIAKAVVDAPVLASWRLYPTITEDMEGNETEFEKAITDLEDKLKIYHYLSRVDRLSGIGSYAILLLGFRDGLELSEEVTQGNELLYIQAYSEKNAKIEEWNIDTKNERYGKPEKYKVNVSIPNQTSDSSIMVHHSRILHVSEGMLESDVFGTSRLEPILNRLFDLDLIMGGGAEMFWRGAFPGFGLIAHPDATFTEEGQGLEALETEMDAYIHNLQRYFRVQDVDIHEMATQVADPSNHVDVQLTAISAATGIPKRILIGSERGELASSQDETAWNVKVDERRTNYIEPMIVRPFYDRLIGLGILPEPKDGFTVDWDDLFVPNDKDKALVSKTKAEAISIYGNSAGAEQVVPLEMFLRKILDFTEDEIEQATNTIEDMVEEEDEKVKEEADLLRKEVKEDQASSLQGDLQKIDKQGSFKTLPQGFKA